LGLVYSLLKPELFVGGGPSGTRAGPVFLQAGKLLRIVILIPQSREKDLLFDKSTTSRFFVVPMQSIGTPQNDIIDGLSSAH